MRSSVVSGHPAPGFSPRLLSILDSGDDLFEVDFFVLYVFDLLRAFGFALDGDGSGVAEVVEFGEDLFEVDQAFADEDFFAELHWIGGPLAVFGVDAADVRADDVDGVDWIGLAVEDEVGGVQTHTQVWLVRVFDGA